ncbi:MAG: STAS domain-containing protein [Burkholderiales bacterium]
MTGSGSAAEIDAGFRADADGANWRYAGALTVENAEAVLEASRALALPRTGGIDLGALDPADSAALAVLLAVRRRARAEGRDVTYASMPAALVSLARVYGIDGLLGCAEPADR